jgi:hypothetical protein
LTWPTISGTRPTAATVRRALLVGAQRVRRKKKSPLRGRRAAGFSWTELCAAAVGEAVPSRAAILVVFCACNDGGRAGGAVDETVAPTYPAASRWTHIGGKIGWVDETRKTGRLCRRASSSRPNATDQTVAAGVVGTAIFPTSAQPRKITSSFLRRGRWASPLYWRSVDVM